MPDHSENWQQFCLQCCHTHCQILEQCVLSSPNVKALRLWEVCWWNISPLLGGLLGKHLTAYWIEALITMPDGADHSSLVTGYFVKWLVDECMRGFQGPDDLSWKWGTEMWLDVWLRNTTCYLIESIMIDITDISKQLFYKIMKIMWYTPNPHGWGLGGGHLQPHNMGGSFNLFYGHHQGCLNNPIFSNLGLCAVCWAHFICHHELWPTSVGSPFPFLNSSWGLTGGKHYQKITITIFKFVLQNFTIPGYFPYIIFYNCPFSLHPPDSFVIAVCGSIPVQGTS